MEEFYIEQLTTFSPELTLAINNLLTQLNPASNKLKDADIIFMLNSSSNHLFVARRKESKQIVGMVTLITYRIPYAMKGWLEDFVVDSSLRGKGVGSLLVSTAMQMAKKKGLNYVDLTSNPSRESANRLYQKLGFEKRETNVYRLVL